MVDDEDEKRESSLSLDHDNNLLPLDPHLPLPPPPTSRLTRLRKHFFPLVKSRSSTNLTATVNTPTPAIITTSPTIPVELSSASNDLHPTSTSTDPGRLSSSSIENAEIAVSSGSSDRSSHSAPRAHNSSTSNRTHLHMLTSATLAASIGINRIHFDDNLSIRASEERISSQLSPAIRISSNSDATDSESAASGREGSISGKERLLRKLIPSQLIRRTYRQRRKNHSIHSLSQIESVAQQTSRSVPSSPKLSAQSSRILSARSSNEDRPRHLLPLPLPALKSSESLPASTRPLLPPSMTSAATLSVLPSPIRPPNRGRSSTVSSISSDVAPRTSRSRTRRASTIFGNLKGRESGRGTPIEKLSFEYEEEEAQSLPAADTLSGEEYLKKLQSEEGGLPKYIRKLVESSESLHSCTLSEYLKSIDFNGLPLDMAMRYLLLHLILPKEQGAIYRLLEIFAQRYHECNPSLWDSHDQILVLCYSMLMLNTDAWNTNNKVKMTREQYVKNTSGQGVSEDILLCWYDNITVAPFVDSTHHTFSKLRDARPGMIDRITRPTLDIYQPLIEAKLDELKVTQSSTGKEFCRALEISLSYCGTKERFDIEEIQSIIDSAKEVTLLNRGRAKSEGFALARLSILNTIHGESTRLIKAGVVSRRERISRFGRMSGWQWIETGVVLLDSRIIFVKGDILGVKSLMEADEVDSEIIIPPLGGEIILDLPGSIAVYDPSIKGEHDYIIRLVSQSGSSEILSVSTEDELNEWVGLINYVAATSTAQSPPDETTSLSPSMLRRRAGTMSPPAGRPVPLRAVSSTLELRARSKSEQPSVVPAIGDKPRLYSTFNKDLEAKLPLQKVTLQGLIRQVNGLLLQTPIQERTRFHVLMALERVTKRLKANRIDLQRSECYLGILSSLLSIMAENKVRLVESESTDDFQLPVFGFDVGHRKNNPSEMTTDSVNTMLSSRTLYSALNPAVEDSLDIPVRRVGPLTTSANGTNGEDQSVNTSANATNKAGTAVKVKDGIEEVTGIVVPEQIKREVRWSPNESHPHRGQSSSTPATPTLRVAEITKIIHEGGF